MTPVSPAFFAEMRTHLEVMGKKGVSASDADKPLCITLRQIGFCFHHFPPLFDA